MCCLNINLSSFYGILGQKQYGSKLASYNLGCSLYKIKYIGVSIILKPKKKILPSISIGLTFIIFNTLLNSCLKFTSRIHHILAHKKCLNVTTAMASEYRKHVT